MKKTKTKKTEKQEPYHLLMYVEDSNPKIKRFKTTDELGRFIDDFNKKWPDQEAMDSGYWMDYCISNITGDIHLLSTGIEVE